MRLKFGIIIGLCLCSLVGCKKEPEVTTEVFMDQLAETTNSDSVNEVTTEQSIEFKNTSQKLYTTKTLNVYGKPIAGTEIVASYTYGSRIEITGTSDDGWYRIKLQSETENTEGFIYCSENDLVKKLESPESEKNITYEESETDITEMSDDSNSSETTKTSPKKKSKKNKASFSQIKPDYSTDEVVPKTPEAPVFDVNNQ